MRQPEHIDDRMAKPGLILRRVDEPNKRSYRLWLTEAGREAAQQAMAEWAQWLRTVNER